MSTVLAYQLIIKFSEHEEKTTNKQQIRSEHWLLCLPTTRYRVATDQT